MSAAGRTERSGIGAADTSQATIAQLFERQAALTPEAVAVISKGRRLTYRELDQRSNQLARHLQHLGVGPDILTGIAVERSVEMMVGLLAILKAGGAYVPIDPSFPPQRIALMIEDSQAPVILATEQTKSRLPETARRIVLLDGDAAAVEKNAGRPGFVHGKRAESRIRDLHLGLDRQTQRRDDRAPQRCELFCRHGRGDRACRRCVAGSDQYFFRHFCA